MCCSERGEPRRGLCVCKYGRAIVRVATIIIIIIIKQYKHINIQSLCVCDPVPSPEKPLHLASVSHSRQSENPLFCGPGGNVAAFSGVILPLLRASGFVGFNRVIVIIIISPVYSEPYAAHLFLVSTTSKPNNILIVIRDYNNYYCTH